MSFTRLRPLLIGLSVLLTLVFVVWTVWRNEQTIANGRDAFVELRPVDPLSLVQGYYMALNMQVDLPTREGLGIADARAVFALDDRGVATASRWLDLGEGGEQGRGDAHRLISVPTKSSSGSGRLVGACRSSPIASCSRTGSLRPTRVHATVISACSPMVVRC